MDDREAEIRRSPYMRTYYTNPPPPVARPITTNLSPNPYHPGRSPHHLRLTGRLGTYALHPEQSSEMVSLDKQASSSLVAAALGPSQSAKPRAPDSPLGAVRRAQNAGYNEPVNASSNSRKRNHEALESSSDLSEHDDDDEFSPDTTHRLAPIPLKKCQRQTQSRVKQRPTQRHSDEDYDEEMIDDDEEGFDEDAEEEEALMRLIARRNARKNSSAQKKTPAAKTSKQDRPTTPMGGMANPSPSDNKSNLKKKPKGKPVPQDLKSADVADRMMFRWKNAGRPWVEIRDEYARLTGTRPASSSLSVRFIKLNENLAANGFRDDIHQFFDKTCPSRKYLQKHTKPDLQEVALLKAHTEAEIKQSQPFWKEVAVQMKKTTGEDFAPASLRNKMEEVQRKQFYLGEQTLAKDNQWPPLTGFNAGKTSLFQKMPSPTSGHKDGATHDQNGRRRSTSPDSLFTEERMRNEDDNGTISQSRSPHFFYSKGKDRNTSGTIHHKFEEENESPTHTHPRVSNSNVEHAKDFSSNTPMIVSVDPSTPTPATTAGATLIGRGIGVGPRAGLVRYGDSDDSD